MNRLIFLIITFTFSLNVFAKEHRQILLLNSFSVDNLWSWNIYMDINDELYADSISFTLHKLDMDSQRFYSQQYIEDLSQLIKSKYPINYFDLIVIADDDALDFIIKYPYLFNNVSKVFCGINNLDKHRVENIKNLTGVFHNSNPLTSVKFIKNYFPKVTNILVVNDYLTTGVLVKKLFLDNAVANYPEINFVFNENVPIKELQNTIKNLPKNSAIIIGSYSMDSQGMFFDQYQTAKSLAINKDVPLTASIDIYINDVVLGGELFQSKNHGAIAGKMAAEILKGKPIDSIQMVFDTSSVITIDLAVAKQFGLKERDFPDETIFYNRKIPIFESHKEEFLFVVFIVLALLVTTIIMSVIIRKKIRYGIKLKAKENEKFKKIIESSHEGVIIYLDGKLVFANKRFLDITGYSYEDLFLLSYIELVVDEDKEKVIIRRNEMLKGDDLKDDFEVRLHKKDGSVIDVLTNSGLIMYDGKLSTYVFIKDFTESKRMQHLLHQNDKKYRSLFDNAHQPFLIIDREQIIDCNNAAITLFNTESKEQLISTTIYNLSPIEQQNLIRTKDYGYSIREAIKTTGSLSFEWKHKKITGEVFPCNVHLKRVEFNDGVYTMVSIEDLTEKNRKQEELNESEKIYKAFFDNTLGAILLYENNVVTTCNPAAVAFFELDRPDDIIGKTTSQFSPEYQDNEVKSKDMINDFNDNLFVKGDVTFNWNFLTKSGKVKTAKVLNKRIAIKGVDVEFVAIDDITQQVKDAKEILDSKKQLQELNATKDKFFSIIAHDLKNPFNTLIGYSLLLEKAIKNSNSEQIKTYSEIIKQSSQGGFILLNNLLEWSRSQTGAISYLPEDVDIVDIIEPVITLLKASADNKNIDLTYPDKQSVLVSCDVNMITTVIRNLITNAIKFTPDGGSVYVINNIEDDYLQISIKDTGVGIPKEVIPKLFKIEENYSTKGTEGEKGTGLGIILCDEFITWHNSTLIIESEVGKGSSFSFKLPLV